MSNWRNTFTLGGLLLDRDDSGTFRVVETVTGWDDGPAVRSGLASKSQQDGSWDGTGYSSERVVGLAGLVQEPTAAAAQAFKDSLTALRPQGSHVLEVVNGVGTRTSVVRVTAGATFDWLDDTAFTYALQVTAPDSLKYGPLAFATATLSTATPGAGLVYPLAYPLDYGIAPGVTPGAVSVANAGTAAYWPRLRVDGPVTNPVVSLVESGAWVRYNGSLLAGQWLDIDLANRRVLLQGQVSVRQKVTSSGDWLTISPGSSSIVWAADSADPAALLSVWSYEGSWI